MSISLKYLSEFQRAEIARSLFKTTSEDSNKGEIHGLCPIHGESNPSFSYNYKKDSYNCLACGAHGDLIGLYTEVNKYSQMDGFKKFCEDYNVPLEKKERPSNNDKAVELSHDQIVALMNTAWEKFPPLGLIEVVKDGDTHEPSLSVAKEISLDWYYDLLKKRGWSATMLDMLDIRLETWRYSKKNGNIYQVKNPCKVAIPIHDISGNLINIRLYHPEAKEYKIISFGPTTGDSALFPAKPLYDNRPVLLCEGESDTICALSHGFNAITQTSKLIKWPKEHLAPFKGRDVVIAYDADEPGQKYARAAANALIGTAKSVRMLLWPAFMGSDDTGAIPKNHGQDLTDFFVRHGQKAEDLQALIDAATPWPPAPVSIPADSDNTAPSSVIPAKAGIQSGSDDPAGKDKTIDNTNDVAQFFEHGINNRYSFKPRLLAERILNDVKIMTDSSTGLVYRWNDKYWEEYEESHLKKRAVELLRNEAQKSRVEDAIFQIKMLTTMPPGRKLNDRMDHINLKSGILNITTFEIIPHAEDFYFTSMLPIDFDPESDKKCETFLKYLDTNIATPEVIDQLQEFTGYCLVRHCKYEKALYLIGPGADGKSTYMKILRELVGPENCSAVSFSAIEDQFQRSAMYNRLVNLSAEIGAESLESQYFKKIVSGDTLQAAYKHVDSFEFDPFCKLVFAGNMLPRVRDNTDGYFRKLLIIQMKKQFLEDDPGRDPYLFDKLKEELSEIFYWALCGLKRLVEQGHFTFADETRECLQDYKRLNNPVLCYVEEECEFGQDAQVSKKDIYSDYVNYCKRNGYTGLNAGNFFRELKSVFRNLKDYRPRKDNPDRLPYVQGIKIKVNAE